MNAMHRDLNNANNFSTNESTLMKMDYTKNFLFFKQCLKAFQSATWINIPDDIDIDLQEEFLAETVNSNTSEVDTLMTIFTQIIFKTYPHSKRTFWRISDKEDLPKVKNFVIMDVEEETLVLLPWVCPANIFNN